MKTLAVHFTLTDESPIVCGARLQVHQDTTSAVGSVTCKKCMKTPAYALASLPIVEVDITIDCVECDKVQPIICLVRYHDHDMACCGKMVSPANSTTDTALVTCKACKRTPYYACYTF